VSGFHPVALMIHLGSSEPDPRIPVEERKLGDETTSLPRRRYKFARDEKSRKVKKNSPCV
jgi:hypothetical protein